MLSKRNCNFLFVYVTKYTQDTMKNEYKCYIAQ